MSILYAVGGTGNLSGKSIAEASTFSNGLVLEIDTQARTVREILKYVTPPAQCPDEHPSILFKAANRVGNILHLCTTTEIMTYDLEQRQLSGIFSDRRFNDVHHVTATPSGTRLVAITGLDLVSEVSADNRITHDWNVLGEDPWERFSETSDYRKVHSTKPHGSHPNFVFFIGDEPFVTRHIQRDAVSLHNPQRRIAIDVEAPHDGVVHENQVYFTTIDGHVVTADCDSLDVTGVLDLTKITDSDSPLGWCRGLHVTDEGHFLVGFSRLRVTKFKENLAWTRKHVKKALGAGSPEKSGRPMPTRISCYDPSAGKHCWDIELEEYGMNAIFSIS